MKSPLTLVFTAMLLAAAPAWAADGQLSKQQLDSLGLGDLHVLSDAEGLTIRGMQGTGKITQSFGVLIVSTRLYDPTTKLGGTAAGSLDDADTDSTSNATSVSSTVILNNGQPAGIAGSLSISLDGRPTFNGLFSAGGLGRSSALGSLLSNP